MIIYTDDRYAAVNFGLEQLENALRENREFFIRKPLKMFTGHASEKSLVVSFGETAIKKTETKLEDGGFSIAREGNILFVTGGDYIGAMYGLFDVAETLSLFGPDAVKSKTENPFLKLRGVKFNLPFEPFAYGDPFTKNEKTCLDPEFWKEYIDFLARNRYNCLSLWTEHPFHMMFRLQKYPDTCPYSDTELERYKDLYKFIFGHARERGIEVFLITWNIRITPFIARGLGLPEELGDMMVPGDGAYDKRNTLPRNDTEFWPVRQHLEVIKDYFRECLKTLAMTYRDLTGIGTNCAEEMVGGPVERQDWVTETYLEAVRECGRDLPFIMRTNMGNGKVAEKFLNAYPSPRKYISWKYSNAHMYSHEQPRFEELWGAWEDVNLEKVKVLYTVRNDDFHTLRWGDPDYLKRYITGMRKPYVEGFYWGADGYLWADDFQHIPGGHKTWKYDFERHWHEFELMGRLSYNPGLPDDIWVEKYKRHYGPLWGEEFFRGIRAASAIIPAVNRLFWIDYDYQWHPESLLSFFGFKTILDFVAGEPMPGPKITGIRKYVENALQNAGQEGELPTDIIGILKRSVVSVRESVKKLEEAVPAEALGGEIECALLDLKAWAELGRYYVDKFSAALELAFFEKDGDESRKNRAVGYLEDGLAAWTELSQIGSQHYMPYQMARVKYIFGWSYYRRNVEQDIELARDFQSGLPPKE